MAYPATLGKLPVQRLGARPDLARDRPPDATRRYAVPVPGDPRFQALCDGSKGKDLRPKARRLKLVRKVERPSLGESGSRVRRVRTADRARAGFQHSAVLDALVEPAHEVVPVRVPGLDLHGEDFAPGDVDDVDAITGEKLLLRHGFGVPETGVDLPGIAQHPQTKGPVVGTFPGTATGGAPAFHRGRREGRSCTYSPWRLA